MASRWPQPGAHGGVHRPPVLPRPTCLQLVCLTSAQPCISARQIPSELAVILTGPGVCVLHPPRCCTCATTALPRCASCASRACTPLCRSALWPARRPASRRVCCWARRPAPGRQAWPRCRCHRAPSVAILNSNGLPVMLQGDFHPLPARPRPQVSCNDCDLLWELDSCYWLEKLASAYKARATGRCSPQGVGCFSLHPQGLGDPAPRYADEEWMQRGIDKTPRGRPLCCTWPPAGAAPAAGGGAATGWCRLLDDELLPAAQVGPLARVPACPLLCGFVARVHAPCPALFMLSSRMSHQQITLRQSCTLAGRPAVRAPLRGAHALPCRRPHTLAQKEAGWERPWLCEAKVGAAPGGRRRAAGGRRGQQLPTQGPETTLVRWWRSTR